MTLPCSVHYRPEPKADLESAVYALCVQSKGSCFSWVRRGCYFTLEALFPVSCFSPSCLSVLQLGSLNCPSLLWLELLQHTLKKKKHTHRHYVAYAWPPPINIHSCITVNKDTHTHNTNLYWRHLCPDKSCD